MTEDFSKRLEGFEAVWRRVQGEKVSPAQKPRSTQSPSPGNPAAQQKNRQGQNRRRNNQRPGGRRY